MEDLIDDELAAFNFTNSTYNDTIAGDLDQGVPSVGLTPGYCGTTLKSFAKSYRGIHGYLSLIVCLFGAQANILNLIVLTRKEMINPTNAILTGLALADLLNMVEYIPYAVFLILPGSKSYAWAVFVLIHSNFSQVCHTISIWLTVTLAVWRYIMVAMHTKCKTLCSMERAKLAIGLAYITSPLLCIPIYLSFSIASFSAIQSPPESGLAVNGNATNLETNYSVISTQATFTTSALPPTNSTADQTIQYYVNLSKMAQNNPFLMTTNFWLYSVVIKIIPCIMLTVVSYRLINSLMEAKKRKEKLLAKRTAPALAGGNHAVAPVGGNAPQRVHDHESSGSDRTTRMLLAILLLFLITECPQGLLGLLSGLLGDDFFKSCYIPLADPMDFVALLNSAINFILYCAMSKKFRETFSQVFQLHRLSKLVRRHSATGDVPAKSEVNNHSQHTTVHLLPDQSCV